jgi:hypothetical protein
MFALIHLIQSPFPHVPLKLLHLQLHPMLQHAASVTKIVEAITFPLTLVLIFFLAAATVLITEKVKNVV